VDESQASNAGTPRQGVSGVPGTDPVSAGLQSMASITEKNTAVMGAMLKQLELMQRSLASSNKEVATFGVEFRDTMRDAAAVESSFRRITQLQKTVLKGGTSRNQALSTIKDMISEYETLLTTMNRTKGGGRYITDINKNLKDMQKALKLVETQNDATWDAKQIGEVNRQLLETGKAVKSLADNMKNLKIKGMRDEFRELGTAIDDAFGGRINAAIRRVPILNGAMKGLDLGRQFRTAHANVTKFRADRAGSASSPEQRALMVARTHGSAGLRMMQSMGHQVPGGAPSSSVPTKSALAGWRSHSTLRGSQGTAQLKDAAARTSAAGSKTAQSIEKMEIGTIVADTLIVGRQGKQRGGRVPFTSKGRPKVSLSEAADPLNPKTRKGGTFRRVPTPTPEGIQQILGGKGGNALSRILTKRGLASKASGGKAGGLLGKIGQFFMKKGGSSAGAGLQSMLVGGASKGASGLLSLGSKLSGPMAIAGALIQAHDMVAANNRKVAEGLGGSGLFGGKMGAADSINNARRTLMSTGLGQTAFLGQGMDKNLDLYKGLAEQGIGTGKTLREGGLDLGQALDGGQGFHGAVMQNAVYHGSLVGMSQQDATKQTLKLIDKFGAVTDATKQFFVDLNELSDTSGISASRIVDMVDDISDQFTDLQKSLVSTVGALQNVGKAGILTGKKLQDTVKGLTAPPDMSTAQRMHNAEEIIKSGAGGAIATSLEGANAAELARVNRTLGKYGISDASTGSHGDIVDRIRAGGGSVDQETRRADLNAYYDFRRRFAQNKQQAEAWRSGRTDEIAARDEMAGVSPQQAHAQVMQLLRSVLKTGKVEDGEMDAILGGDADLLAKKVSGNLPLAKAVESVFTSNRTDIMSTMQRATQARDAGSSLVMDIAGGVGDGGVASLLTNTKDETKNRSNRSKHAILTKFGTAARSLTEPNEGESDADALVRYVKNHKGGLAGPLRDLLGKSQDLQDAVVDGTGVLAEALKEKSDEDMQRENRTKEEDKRAVTLETGQLIAQSFEYLFTRIVDALTLLTNIFGGGPEKAEREKKRMEEQKAPFKAYADAVVAAANKKDGLDSSQVRNLKAKAEYASVGTKAEMERKKQELTKEAEHLGINVKQAEATATATPVLRSHLDAFVRMGRGLEGTYGTNASWGGGKFGKTTGEALAGATTEDKVTAIREIAAHLTQEGKNVNVSDENGNLRVDVPESLKEYFNALITSAQVGRVGQRPEGGMTQNVFYDVSVSKNSGVSSAAKSPQVVAASTPGGK